MALSICHVQRFLPYCLRRSWIDILGLGLGLKFFGSCTMPSIHTKCRNSSYPRSSVQRFPVPDEKVSWCASWPDYKPVSYTSPDILDKPFADPEIGVRNFEPKWHHLDGEVDRRSHVGTYPIQNGIPLVRNFEPKWHHLDGEVDRRSHVGTYPIQNGIPLNPVGRTGVKGRGLLGRWGPNHAADPIVTRWKDGKAIQMDTQRPILQFVAIQRRDSEEWAIPGGMIDPGEKVTATLPREFAEEALNSESLTEKQQVELLAMLKDLFSKGLEVYHGYVDDPRNTDNAWMETVAYNFHDEDGTSVGRLSLQAGSDARSVQWMDLSSHLALYASHSCFLETVARMHGAHW
ncbi:unnamed protein product [Darwinula stevensoni]|uniref:Nudix hydrolase domain-containing protein n=1 Tax=Darwinula stevensoni TaxID=69355 RepID=A0A7R9A2H9_9CRUS|nr:unnamed protein product [Darwinula stevensoni]CAG0889741.1 unnamed protein product [Darwinula stevensoni]